MGAVAAKTIADLRSRRLQTVVLATVLFLASGAATLAMSILIESNAPFERAFERANGAHLVVDFQPSVSEAQMLATASAAPVISSAGPWPIATGAFRSANGGLIGDRTASGRPQTADSIDLVTISAGRWWQTSGEAVLDQDTAAMLGLSVGDTLSVYPEPARRGPEFSVRVRRSKAGPSGASGERRANAPAHADRGRHRRVGQHARCRRLGASHRHRDDDPDGATGPADALPRRPVRVGGGPVRCPGRHHCRQCRRTASRTR